MRFDQVRQRGTYLKREASLLAPKPQGNPRHGKLTGGTGWVERRIAAQSDLAIDEVSAELTARQRIKVHRSSVGRMQLRLGLCHKKTRQRLSRSARTWPIWQPGLHRQTPASQASHLKRWDFINKREPLMRLWFKHNGEG